MPLWCWEVDERVIAPEAAWDEAVGESAPDRAGGTGAAPPWLESDPVPQGCLSRNESGPSAAAAGPSCVSVNAHLHPYQATHFDPLPVDWWEDKDVWPDARKSLTFIDPQATVTGDPIPVRCAPRGITVSCHLEKPGVPTRCDCEQCKQILQREAIRQRNEYLEARNKAFSAEFARARERAAAEAAAT
eukprot:669396-Rhodomonas_salina.1